jgi:hypothetical protein
MSLEWRWSYIPVSSAVVTGENFQRNTQAHAIRAVYLQLHV